MLKNILISLVFSTSVFAGSGNLLGPLIAGGTTGTNIVNSTNIFNGGGVTNGQPTVNIAGYFRGSTYGFEHYGNPVKCYVFGDSLMQNLRVNGWLSQGGYSNQYSTGDSTNGYLYYNVGSYAAANIAIIDVITNILALRLGYPLQVDTAGAVPGMRGADIWGTFNGSNYISATALQANYNWDQTHGFTYDSSGGSSAVVHGDPLALAFWPGSTNDIYFTVQGTSYTNFPASNNAPISFIVTGNGYVSITFTGTPNAVSTAYITRAWKAGGASSKYVPPYTSANDGFNFSGGDIPAGIWAISNAPVTTGIPAVCLLSWGNNDCTLLTTNANVIWTNQVNFSTYLHGLGYSVVLISASDNPNLVGAAGMTMTNLFTLQMSNWPSYFEGFYNLQLTNALLGKAQVGTNYIDGTHWTTLYSGQNATNAVAAFDWLTLSLPSVPVSSSYSFTSTNISLGIPLYSGPNPVFQQTNVLEASGTSFTWQFAKPYADTNYSVSITGDGATLAAPVIGAKTTSAVTVTFTSFSGHIEFVAIHQ